MENLLFFIRRVCVCVYETHTQYMYILFRTRSFDKPKDFGDHGPLNHR